MSDYLTRAAESVRSDNAEIRPRLPALFTSEVATPEPASAPPIARREFNVPEAEAGKISPLRERITAITEAAPKVSQPFEVASSPVTTPKSEPLIRVVEQKSSTPSIHPPPPPQAPRSTVLPRIAEPRVIPPPREDPRSAPPAIHVTIGRVEVRATAPAAPPVPQKSKPSRAPKLSLDDYLRQRNGGRA